MADQEQERARWNEKFRTGRDYKTAVNDWLARMVGDRAPGAALDLCTGQGRNAIYLAQRGWRVTAIDFSDEGLRLAREAALQHAVELELVQADLDDYALGSDRYDLVTMIYAGDEIHVVEHARDSLKRGGLFVLEYFSAESPAAAYAGGWKRGQLAALFGAGFAVVHDEEVDDVSDWGLDPDKLVRFAAVRL